MNYKLFLTTLFILTAITTIFICIARPSMHKSILVYSSEFKIVPQSEIQVAVENIPTITITENNEKQIQNVNISNDQGLNITDQKITYQGINHSEEHFTPQNVEVKKIKVNSSNQQITPQQVNNYNTSFTPQNVTSQGININSNQQYTPQKVTTQGINVKPATTGTKVVTTTPANQKVTTNSPQLGNNNIKTNNPQIDIQKILDNNKKFQQQNQTVQTTPVTTKPVTTTPSQTTTTPVKTTTTPMHTTAQTVQPTTTTNKIAQVPKTVTTVPVTNNRVNNTPVTPTQTVVLTPQEEEIAWQRWRSNLQNQIMRDVKLPNVPQGTTFKFSFDVDKYGKISNIHTTSTNPSYTPYAIQYIMPLIKSYQGRSILNFPTGSRRTTTEFIGSFRINNSGNRYSTTQDYRDTERIIK